MKEKMIDYYREKYVISFEQVTEAINGSEEIAKMAEEIYDENNCSFVMTMRDHTLKEMICAYISRQRNNGIVITLWERCEDGIHVKETGTRSMDAVIDDLVYRIKAEGLEPNEYLLKSTDKISQDDVSGKWSFIFDVNYGGSEGIYFDLYLFVLSKDSEKMVSLLTGKTLDTDVESYFKMNYLSSFCNILLRNDGYKIKNFAEYLDRHKKEEFN